MDLKGSEIDRGDAGDSGVPKEAPSELGDGAEGEVAVALTPEEIAENERLEAINLERRREMNMIHSRRKRERQKIEIAVLREQTAELSAKNLDLYHRNKKLEGLIKDGQEVVDRYEKFVAENPDFKDATSAGTGAGVMPTQGGGQQGLAQFGLGQAHHGTLSTSDEQQPPMILHRDSFNVPNTMVSPAVALAQTQPLGAQQFPMAALPSSSIQPPSNQATMLNMLLQAQPAVQGDPLRASLVQQGLYNHLAFGRGNELQQLLSQPNTQGLARNIMFQAFSPSIPMQMAGIPVMPMHPNVQQLNPIQNAMGVNPSGMPFFLGGNQHTTNFLPPTQLPLQFPGLYAHQGLPSAPTIGNAGSNEAMLDLQSRATSSQGVLQPVPTSSSETVSQAPMPYPLGPLSDGNDMVGPNAQPENNAAGPYAQPDVLRSTCDDDDPPYEETQVDQWSPPSE